MLRTGLPTSPGQEEDLHADPELVKKIHSLAGKDLTPVEVSKLLDVPASTLAATLRAERRKISAILLGIVASDLIGTTKRFQVLMRNVLQELESRDLSNMPNKELFTYAGVIKGWLKEINRAAVLSGDGEKSETSPKDAVTTPELVAALTEAAHKIKREARDVRRSKLPPGERIS